MQRKAIRTEKIECRVSKKLKSEVAKAASYDGMSVTGWIEWLIRRELDRRASVK
ncbi:MAG: hypothetical protein ACYCOU_15305 [Sulfobacillus sp.]